MAGVRACANDLADLIYMTLVRLDRWVCVHDDLW
jgi:hypothetical protein